MTVIIGIDPGSRRTGYGIICLEGNRHRYIASGHINLTSYSEMALRLQHIFLGVQQLVAQYQPKEAAIEQVFIDKSPLSALKLGQARGAAMVALNIPLAEYSARQVKQSVVGHGGANKDQVEYMVRRLLNLSARLQADAADALAIALCHAQARNMKRLLGM